MSTATKQVDAAIDQILDHIDDDPAPQPKRQPPYVAALPASHLFIDDSYQRPLDDYRVAGLGDAFDPTLLGVIEVSARGGDRYAVIDGQHRWALVRDVLGEHTPMVCNVHRGLSPAEEARLFFEIDRGRRALTGWDRWRARRGAGDDLVLTIEAACHVRGLTISDRAQDGVIRATRTLTYIHDLGGTALIDSTLAVVLAAFGPAVDALDGDILHGVALVLTHYDRDELLIERLVAQLQTMPPRQIKARAGLLREANQGQLRRLVAAVVVERYNACPGKKLSPFLERVQPLSKVAPEGSAERRRQAVRLWARRNGIPVGVKGHISPAVTEAYDKAHPAQVGGDAT